MCIYTDTFNLAHLCKETGLCKAGAGCGNKQLGREGALRTLVLCTWGAEGTLPGGQVGTENLIPPLPLCAPLLPALCCTGLRLGRTNPWAGAAGCALPVRCLHLALPGAACWAESPGGGQKLAERMKLFKISCFLYYH